MNSERDEKREANEPCVSRRDFVLWGRDGLTAFLLLFTLGCRKSRSTHDTAQVEKEKQRAEYSLMFFSPVEAATVEAVSARIIPVDDTPGAKEAKAVHFIDYMLANAYKTSQPLYREGISKLNEVSKSRFQHPFVNLSETEQDSILALMEKGVVQGWEQAGQFFALIRAHTIEGMFSDPRYHGNSDRIGWMLMGEAH